MADYNVRSHAWPAPAKINLFLHIIGRRPDGYHLLQTVFQFVDRADMLDFNIRSDGVLSRNSNYSEIESDEDLVIRAARILQAETGCTLGVDITVDKRLPIGGGLGGGSSDAATTLVALNHLWQLDLSIEQLAQLGLILGADVPVFIHGHAAWAEGIGEILTPLDLDEVWYLIVQPYCTVSTSRVFNSEDLTRNTPPITIRDFLAGRGHNDCEIMVRKLYPEIAEAMAWLGRRANVRMTGTGACIYAVFENVAQAEAVHRELPQHWKGFVAQGKNCSPLYERLDQEN